MKNKDNVKYSPDFEHKFIDGKCIIINKNAITILIDRNESYITCKGLKNVEITSFIKLSSPSGLYLIGTNSKGIYCSKTGKRWKKFGLNSEPSAIGEFTETVFSKMCFVETEIGLFRLEKNKWTKCISGKVSGFGELENPHMFIIRNRPNVASRLGEMWKLPYNNVLIGKCEQMINKMWLMNRDGILYISADKKFWQFPNLSIINSEYILQTSDGILLMCSMYRGLLYSKDNGYTWKRSALSDGESISYESERKMYISRSRVTHRNYESKTGTSNWMCVVDKKPNVEEIKNEEKK